MLEYFKDIAYKNSCSTGAVCSIHPSVNSLNEVILSEISEISFYVVKLREFGFQNDEANEFLVETLSIFLINTSLNHKKYFSLVLKLNSLRNEMKEKYLKYCQSNNLSYEIINKNMEITLSTAVPQLIEYGENIIFQRQKNLDKEKQNLFELAALMAKLASINTVKIKNLKKDNSFDYEILRFFSLVNGYTLKTDKIKRKILEFSSLIFEITKKLHRLQKEKFGQKETTAVNLSVQEGYNILVSGDDFDELDEVLKSIENFETKEKINVYTNGALFSANLHPYFKNNRFLKGHYGTDNAEYDFSNFEGAVLITQNFVQKIDSLYKGEIFSKKLISFNKVFDIEKNNYKPLIEAAFKLNKTTKQKKKEIKIEYNTDKLSNLNNETILIAGKPDSSGEIQKKKIEGKNIIFLNPYFEGDILSDKINELREKDIRPAVFFAQCNLINLVLMFSILNSGLDIYLANCSNILINPHVTEALKKNFDIKII